MIAKDEARAHAKHAGLSPYRFPRRKEWYLLIASIFFVSLIGELLLHITISPVYQPTKYGWTVGANRSTTRSYQDSPGIFRTVRNEYFDHGFRRWAVPKQKPTVLIIGDSFTEMVHVSNGEEWYADLEKEFSHINFFVYGGGGYGSLQEYMILDDYIDVIDPDIIIWQFCNNDYRNNFYESERRYYPHNNFGVRPYLEDSEIVYKMPMPFPLLRNYSRIADRLLSRYDAFEKTKIGSKSAANPDHKIPRVERPKEKIPESAYLVTSDILQMARQRAGNRPFFLFSTHSITDKETVLCSKAGVTCIQGVHEYLESKKAEGIPVQIVNDGHWNVAGNRFVGEFLIKYFKNHPDINSFFDGGVN